MIFQPRLRPPAGDFPPSCLPPPPQWLAATPGGPAASSVRHNADRASAIRRLSRGEILAPALGAAARAGTSCLRQAVAPGGPPAGQECAPGFLCQSVVPIVRDLVWQGARNPWRRRTAGDGR